MKNRFFFLSIFTMLLFVLNAAFPYQHECDEGTQQSEIVYQDAETQNPVLGETMQLSSYGSDSCMMNPKNFEMPDDNYKGTYKEFFDARPIKVQPCKNCHTINSQSDSDNQKLYKSRTKQENEQAAYHRMMDNYQREEEENKVYTETVKKYIAEGISGFRKP